MGYDYEELLDKYSHNYRDVNDEELDFLARETKKKLISGAPIDLQAFYILMDETNVCDCSYEYGGVTDFYSHGYVCRELIAHIDGKNYLSYVSWHDDYGIEEYESLDFAEVEKKQVLVEQWVEVEK